MAKKEEVIDVPESYILIEVSDRNFMIAARQIGRKDAFTFVATCRNRGQADRMVDLLNGRVT